VETSALGCDIEKIIVGLPFLLAYDAEGVDGEVGNRSIVANEKTGSQVDHDKIGGHLFPRPCGRVIIQQLHIVPPNIGR
jgi:hypothetical protein